jgi:ferritin-like protein
MMGVGTHGTNLLHDVEPSRVADALNSLHAFELVTSLWCHAVQQRVIGVALYVLPNELEEQSQASIATARRLAARIAQLGSVATFNPTDLLKVAGLDEMLLPTRMSDPGDIVRCAMAYQRQAITRYNDLLTEVDGRDVVTARLLVRVLAEKVAREDEMEASLATDEMRD